MVRLLRVLVVILLVHVSGRPATSQAPPAGKGTGKGQAAEELGQVVARRIEEATGVKVRIGKLIYEVLTSTFVGRDITAGPRKQPYLVIPHLKVELSLFAKGPGTTVVLADVRRPRIRARQRWIEHIYRFPVGQSATIRLGRVRQGEVTIELGDSDLRLEGVNVTVKNLRVPTSRAGAAPALRGDLRLTAAKVKVGTLELTGLSLQGTLADKQLEVKRVALGLPGGEVSLSGTIGFGDGKTGPGPFALTGPFSLRLGGPSSPALAGMVQLAGPTMRRLGLAGKLAGATPPRSGGLKGAPALDLRMRVGRRRFRGTLRAWRVR